MGSRIRRKSITIPGVGVANHGVDKTTAQRASERMRTTDSICSPHRLSIKPLARDSTPRFRYRGLACD